jgi:hypothetical protein
MIGGILSSMALNLGIYEGRLVDIVGQVAL